jgi:hypothetical protein
MAALARAREPPCLQLRCYQQPVHIVVWKARSSRQSLDTLMSSQWVTRSSEIRDEIERGLDWKNGARVESEKPPENATVAGDSCTSVHTAFPQVWRGR